MGMIWPLKSPSTTTRIPESAKAINRAICGATATCAVPGSSGCEKGKHWKHVWKLFSDMILIYFNTISKFPAHVSSWMFIVLHYTVISP